MYTLLLTPPHYWPVRNAFVAAVLNGETFDRTVDGAAVDVADRRKATWWRLSTSEQTSKSWLGLVNGGYSCHFDAKSGR